MKYINNGKLLNNSAVSIFNIGKTKMLMNKKYNILV